MKFLVQAILIDGGIETVVDSLKTDDCKKTLDFVMGRHRHSYNYLYVVLDIATREVLTRTRFNSFQLYDMKLRCPHCGELFAGNASCDEFGWYSICPTCGESFDIHFVEQEGI